MVTYAQYRSAGNVLQSEERGIQSLRERIAFEESRGRGDGQRAQQLRKYLADAEASYSQVRSNQEAQGIDYKTARQSARKNNRTDLANANSYAGNPPNRVNSMYAPGGGQGYTGIKGAANDPRVAQQTRYASVRQQELLSRPGIYTNEEGTTYRSSLSDGSFVADQGRYKGQVVTVRSPVATGSDGRPIYAPAPRSTFGINLFDPNNRAAIQANQGQYGTAGQLFNTAQTEKTYKEQNASSLNDQSRVPGQNYAGPNRYYIPVEVGIQEESSTAKRFRELQKREQNYQEFIEFTRIPKISNYATFGGGRPVEERSFFGRYSQSLVQGTLTLPFALGQGTINTGERAASGVDYLLNKPKDAKLKLETERISPTNPDALATYTLIAAGEGYSQYRSYKTPVSTKFTADSAVVTDSTVSRGAVSGSARVVGRAESTYRYGPFRMFRRTEVVPAQGSLTFSGLRSPGRGQNYAVTVEGVATTTVQNKPVFADVSFKGTYGARSGRTGLVNSKTNEIYVSQAGKGVPKGVLGTERTAPGSSAVFTPDKNGNLVVSQTTRARGFADGGQVNRYNFAAPKKFVARDAPVLAREQGGLRPVGSQFAGTGEQFVRPTSQQGYSLRSADLTFADLRRQGLYKPRQVEPSPMFGDRVRSLARSRKGSASYAQEYVFEQTVQRPRSLPTSTVLNPRTPYFGGLPLGEVKGRQVPNYASAAIFNFRSRSTQGVLPGYDYGFSRHSAQRISATPISRVTPSTVPVVRYDQIPGQRPRQDQVPQLDTSFRFDTIQRTETTPRTIVRTPYTPPFDVPRQPEFPGGPGFGFPGFPIPPGGSGPERGRASRTFQYAPSLTAQFFNIRGRAPTQQLTGFEVRPIAAPRKRRRK